MVQKTVMDAESINEAARRIAAEIIDRNSVLDKLGIIGLRSRGIHFAKRIADEIERATEFRPSLGIVDITLYRDDLRRQTQWPSVMKTDIPFSVENQDIILVDDVVYTGRTTRAAIEAIMDYGRPGSVQLAALVDRGHRELPIQPDYVGISLETSEHEKVEVRLSEMDGKDEVVVVGG